MAMSDNPPTTPVPIIHFLNVSRRSLNNVKRRAADQQRFGPDRFPNRIPRFVQRHIIDVRREESIGRVLENIIHRRTVHLHATLCVSGVGKSDKANQQGRYGQRESDASTECPPARIAGSCRSFGGSGGKLADFPECRDVEDSFALTARATFTGIASLYLNFVSAFAS